MPIRTEKTTWSIFSTRLSTRQNARFLYIAVPNNYAARYSPSADQKRYQSRRVVHLFDPFNKTADLLDAILR